MRIIQAIETSGPGGAEQMMLRMSLELRARGHEVEVLMLKPGWLADRVREAGLPLTVIPLRGTLDGEFRRALRAHLLRRRPHVLHSHEFTFAVFGRIASRSTEAVHVATVHGRNFLCGRKRRLLGTVLLRGRRRFALVAVAENLARHLRRAAWLAGGRVRVVPNGVAVDPHVVASEREAGEPLRLLSVGNLYPVKNHALAIRCVARLRARGLAVELDILGRGADEAELRGLLDRLELGRSVRLRGFRSDVPRFLDRAHALLSTSLTEAMPVSFLEAMARGVPVVASHVGGVSELVEDGATGLLFPSRSLDGAVAAVERIARDEPLRRRLARRALEQVSSRHSIGQTVDRYLELYTALGAQRAAPVACARPAR